MRRIVALIFILLFLVIPQSFAGVNITVGGASISCNGDVSIPVQIDAGVHWSLTIDGTLANSWANLPPNFTATGSVVPQANHIFILELDIEGNVRRVSPTQMNVSRQMAKMYRMSSVKMGA